jgi:hypothetical protein
LRSGLISFDCKKCLNAPYIKENLGCESPTQTPAAWLDENEEWFNCPIRFINKSTLDFIEKYDAYRNKMATPPDFDKQSARFNIAVKYFESELSRFIEMKQGK